MLMWSSGWKAGSVAKQENKGVWAGGGGGFDVANTGYRFQRQGREARRWLVGWGK